MFFILLSALVLYVVLGIPRVNPAHFDNPFPKGVGGVFAAAGLLFTFCAGGFFVVDLGGEVIRASKIFPKVLFIGMIIVISLYILITVVTVGVVETADVNNQSLIVVAEKFMTRPFLIFFIIGGALIACATTINIIFSIISRGLMVVAGEGLLPAFLGKVNERFGTPHWGLTIAYLISSLSLIFIPSLMFFGSMLNLGLVFAITAVVISGMVLPRRYPALFSKATIKISPGWMKIVCIAVIAFNSLIFLFFGFAIGASSILFLGIVLVTTLYALSRKKDLKEIRKKIESRFQKAGA